MLDAEQLLAIIRSILVVVIEQLRPPTNFHQQRDSDLGQRLLLAVVTTLLKPQSLSCSGKTS